MYEINQASLDAIYDQLSAMIDELGKAQRHGNTLMARCARETIDNLHAAAEQLEAKLAVNYAA